jgi:hypothetical protein
MAPAFGRRLLGKKILENGMDGLDLANSKFARALGSVDYHTRERGVQALTRFLQHKQTSLKESDMLKLWKGLYFCFWHSDKAPVQVSRRRLAVNTCMLLLFSLFCNSTQPTWGLLCALCRWTLLSGWQM